MSIFGMPTSSSISMFTPCPLWHAHNTQLPMVHSACTHFVSKTIIACALHENAQHSLFKVQKTLEGFLEHYSGEFIEISCIVEIETLLSILTFHVSLHYWPLLRVPEHVSWNSPLQEVIFTWWLSLTSPVAEKLPIWLPEFWQGEELTEIMTKGLRWVAMGAILRPGWRWRRRRALPIIHFSLVNIEQIIKVNIYCYNLARKYIFASNKIFTCQHWADY